MLEEIAACVRQGQSFAVETTLSGLRYRSHIRRWRADGYHVTLFFLSLPDAETAIDRVAQRVRHGGHHISEPVIRRRFATGLDNFEKIYKPIVDAWMHFDNSGPAPILLAWGETDESN